MSLPWLHILFLSSKTIKKYIIAVRNKSETISALFHHLTGAQPARVYLLCTNRKIPEASMREKAGHQSSDDEPSLKQKRLEPYSVGHRGITGINHISSTTLLIAVHRWSVIRISVLLLGAGILEEFTVKQSSELRWNPLEVNECFRQKVIHWYPLETVDPAVPTSISQRLTVPITQPATTYASNRGCV
ncbi:hypothetical protein C8R45DRAFT_927555 [Mycena sanguinolenta]|nr:hypothetical protein C8R45DRAFT_927555 [Mycena sanguinolenta]